jgi:hypothetical protein
MKLFNLSLVLVLLLIGVASAAFAPSLGDTVNSTCPISGQAVDGTTIVEHAGEKIGVCCVKCQAAVAGWTSEQKDSYLAKLAGAGQAATPKAEGSAAPAFSEPYLLTTCPIAGEPVGDKPTAVTLEGRTIQVCCAKCKSAAEADPTGTLAKVDALIADQQRALYPLTHCVVMPDEALTSEDGTDTAKEVVVGNRLFRVCCPGCIKKVKKDPAKFAAILDEAAQKAQQASYPLAHCVVNPKQVFSEDAPAHEFMVAGRLVRTCCKSCEAKVRAEPLRYVGMIDAGRASSKK